MNNKRGNSALSRSIGTWQVMVAGVALVVAASTLVSDFTGFFTMGVAFVVALVLGFVINLLLGLSAADLSVAYPRAGALYDYARAVFRGKTGETVAVFLGLTFFGMFAFGASGEVTAGAFGLQTVVNDKVALNWYILALAVLALVPNLLGIRTTAWVSAGLLLFMLGIRWFFGIAGFLGVSQTGSWSAAHLDSGIGAFDLFGSGGILAAGLALAFWSFLGIEFACSLAEEVKEPRRTMPLGIVLGLIGILATSVVMGLGVTGTQPLEAWQTAIAGDAGQGGEAPQLAVGEAMFGRIGMVLMALSSVAATLGSLTVALAAMPRIIYSIARDGSFFGSFSRPFGKLHPRFGTPVAATLLTFVVYLIPALAGSSVVEWVYSAAYAWVLLYAVFHLLAILNRVIHPGTIGVFKGRWFSVVAGMGIVLTLVALYYAFAGAHLQYGLRALVVFGAAGAVTALSRILQPRTVRGVIPNSERLVEPVEIRKSA